MSRTHIQKGMFLMGGSQPAHMLAYEDNVMISRRRQREAPPQDEPPPLDEIKIRLQRVQDALNLLRGQAQRR